MGTVKQPKHEHTENEIGTRCFDEVRHSDIGRHEGIRDNVRDIHGQAEE